MQARARNFLTRLFTLLLTASFALAQPNIALAQSGPAFTQQELDQMLAPIALYPDALLSQILMAATYPLEVVEAERWSRANPGLSGDRAVRAVERNNWDPSVKSMVAFPQILGMMSEKLDWTERLGDAFLDQESQVMDTVQYLRQQAQASGNLNSNDNYRVNSQGGYIDIEQANPQSGYVPYYYNPRVVYGGWRYPEYPPVYWSPWPGYRERAGFGTGFAWGVGIALGAEFFFGAFDWQQRHVNVVNVNNYYYPRNTTYAHRAANTWQHEPEHRRGIPYRAPAVREKFSRANEAPESRRDYRGREAAAVAQPGRNDNRNDNRPDARPADTRGGQNNRQGERTGAKPAAAPVAVPAPPDVREGRDGRNSNTRRDDATNPKPVTTAPTPRAETRDERGNRGNERTPPQPAAPAPADQAPARNQRSDPRTAPVTTVRPAPAQPPHALEGLGRGAETRNASERGRSSNAPAPRPPERVAAPAPPPQVAAPPTPQRAAAPTPPQRAPTASPRGNSRENKGKGQNEK